MACVTIGVWGSVGLCSPAKSQGITVGEMSVYVAM